MRPADRARPASKSSFNRSVDQAFYEQVKKENGGKLPPSLLDAQGNPRKLTMSPSDRAYREKWKATAAKIRNSMAIMSKGVKVPCVPCAAKPAGVKIPAIVLPGKGGKKIKVEPAAVVAPPSAGKEARQNEEPCKNETLVVKCGHVNARGFYLELPLQKINGVTQIEVIDDGDEKITCTTKLIAGPCAAIHKGKVFDVYPADSTEKQTDSQLILSANHDPNLKSLSFAELFSPSLSTPQTFEIRTQTCQQEQSLAAILLVYPQLDWTVDISFGATSQGSVNALGSDHTATEDRSSEFDFSGRVAVIVNGLKREFGVEIKHDLNQALEILTLAVKGAEFLWYVADGLGGVEIALQFPQIAFRGDWGWKEIEGSPLCGYTKDLTVGFTPLIGASVKVDILSFLITKFPGIGQMVERLRKAAGKQIDIEVFFEVDGTIDGTFDYKKVATQAIGDASGSLKGKVEFTLEGCVKLDEHWLCVHFGAEAKVGGTASVDATVAAGSDGDGPYIQGSAEFAGLTIYAVAAADGKVSFGDPPKEEDDGGDIAGAGEGQGGDVTVAGQAGTDGLSGSIIYNHEWQLIGRYTLLGSDERHYFTTAGKAN